MIANSRYTADLIAARHRVPKDRIRVIYRGVDLAKFAPESISPARLARLRAAWGVSEDQPVVLQAARLTSWKGQPLVIEAARRLLAEHRLGDAVVVLAGDAQGRDVYRAELEGLIAAAGLEHRVKLPGHCDDMPAAFAIAQVAVIASTSAETFGRTSIEAQAMGCPVIVSDIGAAPETILPAGPGKQDFTGWIVPVRDDAAIAERIAEALGAAAATAGGARRRGRAAMSPPRSPCTSMQQATLAVYDELLGTSPRRRFDQVTALGGSFQSVLGNAIDSAPLAPGLACRLTCQAHFRSCRTLDVCQFGPRGLHRLCLRLCRRRP